MGLIKRLRNRWRKFKEERTLKKAKRRPAKAVIYIAPYEHATAELVNELARYGVKVERHDTPFIKQKPASITVKKMPSITAVEFAKSRKITFKLKGKGKA